MEVSLQSFRKRFTYDPQKDLLGKGGFGEVYKAYDNEDHHFVALKISQGTADDKYNLINEIKRFKKLNHPNIVKHIEAYEVSDGKTDFHGRPTVYHVGILEYADSGTLADLLKKGTPDYRVIEDLAKDIIEGLAYLHNQGIIHRDLKPTNILLFSEGDKLTAKITDFGIAKNTDATAASTQLVGTVEYMAPEYFTTGNITPASDVWSLGVMLLEALTGTHPFGKTSQGLSNEQIINNILNKDVSTATQSITEPLKKIITDCLRREPVFRPQSAEALKADLANPTTDSFTEKTQVIKIKKNSREQRLRLKKLSYTLLFMFLLIVIGITVFFVVKRKNEFSRTFSELVYKIDPVCGKSLTSDIHIDTILFNGKILGFCSLPCKMDFINSPCKYYKPVSHLLNKNDWLLLNIGKDSGNIILSAYLPNSIVSTDNIKRVAVKRITVSPANYEKFKLAYKENRDSGNKCVLVNFDRYMEPAEFEVDIWEIDCLNRKINISSITFYDADNEVKDQKSFSEDAYIDIMPGSLSESMYDAICN